MLADVPESSYTPGPLVAVVTGRTALLADAGLPAAAVRAVWDAARLGAGTDALLVALTGGSTDDLPPFALATVEDDLLRVVARPGTTVAVGDARGPHQLVARGVATPWTSELVPVPEVLWLGTVTDALEVHPLTSGVVRAGWVAWTPQGPEGSGPGHEEADAEPALAPAGPLAPSGPFGPDGEGAVLLDPGPSFAHEFGSEPTVSSPFAGRGTAEFVLPPMPARPGRLRFGDGFVVDVVEPLRIGRAPALEAPGAGRTVTVSNPTREVSRTHVEVRPDGPGVVVVDLGSANGTVVSTPGQEPVRLEPHVPYVLVPGAVVALSADVHAVYEVD